MSRKWLFSLGALFLLIILGAGVIAATSYFENLPRNLSQHETVILGQSRLNAGSQAALRALVRDSRDGSPLKGADVTVSLRSASGGTRQVFSGKTNESGITDVVFKVPEDAATTQTLVIETQSSLGSDKVERSVTIKRDYRILLTTDKPIYQPGQVVHIRTLALNTFDLKAAAKQNIEISITDGKGNRVFRKTQPVSDYGVAAVDFQLASEVNTGNYKISAAMGSVSSEKTVTVEYYVLPKFAVKLKTDRTYYLPGKKVVGSLQSDYFFGKPVAGGKVVIEGYTFDVKQNTVFTLQGKTDDQGRYNFEFTLPTYIAGTDLEGGKGRFFLQASVTDLAQHTETANLSLPVAGAALVIDATPEGGLLRQNVENILYVVTSYPDGSPASAALTITVNTQGSGTPPPNSERITARTGQYGMAEVRRTPRNIRESYLIQARDAQGNTATRTFTFQGDYSANETILLRPDKPVYKVGETMRLTVLSSQSAGTVYLDLVRGGQAVSMRAESIKNGKADIAVDLTPDLYGTLEIHAYKLLTSGQIVRDTRLVVVDSAQDLNISLKPGQETYKPGENGRVNIQVRGANGQGVQSAVGLAIVDESVFALAQQDPGFAKLYFMLEKELLAPKYDLHGFSIPELARGLPGEDPALRAAVNDAAQASMASAVRTRSYNTASIFSLQVNSRQENARRAAEMQQAGFKNLANGLYGLFLLLPLAMVGISFYALRSEKRLGSSLFLTLAVTLVLGFQAFILLWAVSAGQSWATSPLDRLGYALNQLSRVWELSLCLLAFGALGFLVLLIYSAWKKDVTMLWTLGLILVMMFVVVMMLYLASQSGVDPDPEVLVAGLAAYGLAVFALLMRFSGYAVSRRILPAVAALPLAMALPVIVLAVGVAVTSFSGANVMRDGMMEQRAFGVQPPMPALAIAPRQVEPQKAADSAKGMGGAETETPVDEPPRLRQYFPETMLWLPDGMTDSNGNLNINVSMADSITTWRMTALASTQDGRLGSSNAPLRVFQDFFIDLDLPVALTVDDEISVPVGVFNYLTSEQAVRLELDKAPWFELLDEPVKEMKIAANDISVVYFRIKARQFGSQPVKVTAWGSKMSDAIQKEVRVYPNGKQVTFTKSDRLAPGKATRQTVTIPADAIAGTQKLLVKIYPGVVSQVVEGLESLLRMPYGCFEQTSSTTYPNVLVMDYLKTSGKSSPEVQLKAEQYINLGYQRLVTFEVKNSGGFSLFGNPPADRMLTAYGLQEFNDMSRVHDVDNALLKRAAEYLFSQQAADGSWTNDRGLVHESTWQTLGNDKLPVTAYITWSLFDAGFGGDARAQKGLAYVREFSGQAKDPYALALVANALVAADLRSSSKQISSNTNDVLTRLGGMAQRDGEMAYWKSSVATFVGSKGTAGSIETTALAAYAFLRADRQPELANGSLTYLIKQKDSYGTWHNTQATVLTLKALIQTLKSGAEKVNANATVTLNGSRARTIQVNPQNYDVVHLLSFDDVSGGQENVIEINAQGEGSLMYQVSGSYYLPWERLSRYPEIQPATEAVNIEVNYDRNQLAVNDTVNVTVTVKMNMENGRAESAMIDLGIPPGFSVQTEDLANLVAKFKDVPKDYAFPTIQRYELTGRQILIYLNNLSYGKPLTFNYRLKAKFPLVVQSPASTAYDYYNPDVNGTKSPQQLIVK